MSLFATSTRRRSVKPHYPRLDFVAANRHGVRCDWEAQMKHSCNTNAKGGGQMGELHLFADTQVSKHVHSGAPHFPSVLTILMAVFCLVSLSIRERGRWPRNDGGGASAPRPRSLSSARVGTRPRTTFSWRRRYAPMCPTEGSARNASRTPMPPSAKTINSAANSGLDVAPRASPRRESLRP